MTVSAMRSAQGLEFYQGLSECWQLLGSDVLPAAPCGAPPERGGVGGVLSGLKITGYQAWA